MSGDRYQITDQNAIYFLTFTVIDWMDVFTRKEHKETIVNDLNHCVKNKGLTLHAWCLMSNHLHLMARARDGFRLSDIIRDYKKHTAKTIIKAIREEPESRRDWLLDRMAFRARQIKRVKDYKFWEDDNHAIHLDGHSNYERILDYIHNNPVEARIVDRPEDYLFSSARDYAGLNGLVKCELLV